MIKLLKYLKDAGWAVPLIILLLIVQAYCDLALPTYTSQIVDVGIQQGGIEYVAPLAMRGETMTMLQLLLPEDQAAELEAAYAPAGDGSVVRTADEPAQLARLEELLTQPAFVLSTLRDYQTQYGLPVGEMKDALEQGQLTRSDGLLLREQLVALAEEKGDANTLIRQKALLFVKLEYQALEMDLGQIQLDYLLVTGGKMLAVSLVMVAAAILVGLLASRAAARIGRNLRKRVFERVVSFGNAEMDQFSTASLITRSTNDIQQIQMVSVMLLRMVLYAPIVGIGGIIKVSNTQTGMGWIIGVAVGAVMALVILLMSLALPKFKKMQLLVDRLNLVSREILTGLNVIRAFSREKHEEKRFDLANLDLMKTQRFTSRCMSLMMPAMMMIMNCVSVLIVWNGAHGADLGTMQVGDMMAFLTYTMTIIMAFLMISMIAIFLPRAGVAATRIDEVLSTEPTVRDRRRVQDQSREDWTGVVAFEDVSFRYPDAGADVLEHISFTAAPGQTTAIIGSTGSGKSTLINLIPRFFDVSYGRITLDGVDIRDLSQHKLRSLMGYVPQKGILFSGDIESNLKFGGADITDEEMYAAAAIAQATEFIQGKPEGYHSPIAQGGSNVSGGQKQRLAIARAVAKHPKVLLFDDSFSALDYKTDVVLRRALAEQTADAAVIIVAQRISTILHADQIVVLNEGQVAGIGSHEVLMKTCETYQEIAKSQLSEAELGGAGA